MKHSFTCEVLHWFQGILFINISWQCLKKNHLVNLSINTLSKLKANCSTPKSLYLQQLVVFVSFFQFWKIQHKHRYRHFFYVLSNKSSRRFGNEYPAKSPAPGASGEHSIVHRLCCKFYNLLHRWLSQWRHQIESQNSKVLRIHIKSLSSWFSAV